MLAQTLTEKLDHFYELTYHEMVQFIEEIEKGEIEKDCGPKDFIKIQKIIAHLARIGTPKEDLPAIEKELQEMEKYNHPKQILDEILADLSITFSKKYNKNQVTEAIENINWILKYHKEFEITEPQLQALKQFRTHLKKHPNSTKIKTHLKQLLLILS
ncbi:MAG: hypothetical protein P0S94_02825 [Simkaniaceae bacterium]|nr:hypothetical protein [Simkaniaceae bacterium]